MKPTFPALLFMLLPGSLLASKVEMPTWGETTEAESYHLGGGLWPSGLLSDAGENEAESGTVARTEGVGEPGTVVAEDAVRFYGPAGATPEEEISGEETVASRDSEGVPEGSEVAEPLIEPLPPIEGELRDLYFAHAPVDFLIDPQRLLTEQKSNDIKRFLEFHSDESEIGIYVMVLGETQEIPGDLDLRTLHKNWFSENPTVLMVYYRELPEMTEFVYNERIRSALPKSVFERMHQNCLREGAATDLAPDQVEKMAIELSIQLYWLSRLMAQEGSEAQERVAATPAHELPASANAPELLREYAPGIFVEQSGRRLASIILTALVILGSMIVIVCLGWSVMWWRAWDRVAGAPLIFPSFQVVPRLGGEFSGGGFVGMSFEMGARSDLSR